MFADGGFAGEANLTYAWPDALAKAQFVLAAIRREAEMRELPVQEWCVEYFGVNGFGGPTVGDVSDADPPEVVGRLAWRTESATAAQAVGALVRTIALTGPPGLQGIGRGPAPSGGSSRATWCACSPASTAS